MASTLGDTKYTYGSIHNFSGKALTLISHEIWVGASPPFPDVILNQGTGEFTQSADPGNGTTPGCVGGLAYKFTSNDSKELTWVIVWSNPEGADSKVYTDLIDVQMQWSEIRNHLEKDGRPNYQIDKYGFHLEIDIPPGDRTATMKATIEAPFFKAEQGKEGAGTA